MIHPVGTRVKICSNVKHHADKTGMVVVENTSCGTLEMGISFGRSAHVDAWFLSTEVEIYKPTLALVTFPIES